MTVSTLPFEAVGDRVWDVVIIGAGPCGGVAAHEAARRGLRTLLVEKAEMPRSKVCGGCLAQGGIASLQRLGLDSVLEDAVRLHRLNVCTAGRDVGLAVRAMLGIDRTRMDARLTQLAAEAGAEVMDGTAASVAQDGLVTLCRHDVSLELQASAVIIADGLSGSSMGDEPAFAWRIGRRSKVGVGGVGERAKGLPDDSITMCIGRSGYVGFAPIQGDRMAVAAAMNIDSLGQAGGVRQAMEQIIETSGVSIRVAAELPLRGTAQLTRRRARVEGGRVLIAGDAAGYVEPFTGEGMSWAIRSGELSAAFAEQLVQGQLRQGAWTAALGNEFGVARRRCAAVATLLDRPGLLRIAMSLANLAPRAAATMSGAFGRVAQGGVA